MNNREYSGISEHNIFRILKNRKYQRMPKGSVFEHQLSKLNFYCNGDGTLSVYGPSSGEPKEGIQIPGFVYGMKVVHICERAFEYQTNLHIVLLPETIISIGDRAFASCSMLYKVLVKGVVQSIGREAFADCIRLREILFPEYKPVKYENSSGNNISSDIHYIGDSAFCNCVSIEKIRIPDQCSRIEKNAFSGCRRLRLIELPFSISSIDDEAFTNTNLEEIHAESFTKDKWREFVKRNNFFIEAHIFLMEGDNDGIININGITFFVDLQKEETVVVGCDPSATSLVIPRVVGGFPVKSIGAHAFNSCKLLKQITIPDTISQINKKLFPLFSVISEINVSEENSNYKSVDGVLFDKTGQTLIKYPPEKRGSAYQIPESVASINEYAFFNCKYLHSIIIPSSVISIGKNSLLNCLNLKLIDVMQHENNISGAPWGAEYNAMVKWN